MNKHDLTVRNAARVITALRTVLAALSPDDSEAELTRILTGYFPGHYRKLGKDYFRNRARDRKAMGLCRTCGKDKAGKSAYCAKHKEQARLYNKRAAKIRFESGLCRNCPNKRGKANICQDCRRKRYESHERFKAKRKLGALSASSPVCINPHLSPIAHNTEGNDNAETS